MARLRAFLLLVLFAGFTLPLMPLQQVLVWFFPAGARGFPHWYHRQVAKILGFHIRVSGVAQQSGPALLVANHVSWIDIVALSAVAPVCFVAKSQVARWPFFGSLARLQRTVFVDRERRLTTGEERDGISARLRQGDTLVLFPEGTSGDGHSVQPFKSAYFGAVDNPDIAIIPVTLAYDQLWGLPMTRRHRPLFAWYGDMDLAPHLWDALKTGPIGIHIIFHAPLHLASPKDRKRVAAAAEEQVRAGLAAALHGPRQMR